MKERSFSDIIRNGLAGLFHIFAKELKATVRDEGVLIFFLLVPLAYPLVYAFIYTNEWYVKFLPQLWMTTTLHLAGNIYG